MPKQKRLATLNDGCNPELVWGADFDGRLEIPIIKKITSRQFPKAIIPFTKRNCIPPSDRNEYALGFFENDSKFADVLIHPKMYLSEFRQFAFIMQIDCSMYHDAPLAAQVINLYRSRAIGSYYQRHNVNVVPLVRWGEEATFNLSYFPERIAFLGIEKQSVICISTYGCIKSKQEKANFKAGLDAMIKTLEPSLVFVHGAMPNSVFKEYKLNTNFIHIPDWTTYKHMKGRKK
jgi:hypothetical protein